MTKQLESAISRVSGLPEEEQDVIASVILQELESEERWRVAFESSQDQLANLAREAREEYRAGKTKPLDPGNL